MIYIRTARADEMLQNGKSNLPVKIRTLLSLVDGESHDHHLQYLFGHTDILVLLKSLVWLELIKPLEETQQASKAFGNLSLVQNHSAQKQVNG